MKEVVYLGNIPAVANAIHQLSGCQLKAVLIEAEEDREAFEYIESLGIPIYRIPDSKVLSAALESFTPFEVGVIANFGMILSEDDIACADLGFVNAHPGLLPENKGRNPIQRCLLEKMTETGICLHRVTPKVDEGEVLFQERVTVASTDTHASLCKKLYGIAPKLIQKYILSL